MVQEAFSPGRRRCRRDRRCRQMARRGDDSLCLDRPAASSAIMSCSIRRSAGSGRDRILRTGRPSTIRSASRCTSCSSGRLPSDCVRAPRRVPVSVRRDRRHRRPLTVRAGISPAGPVGRSPTNVVVFVEGVVRAASAGAVHLRARSATSRDCSKCSIQTWPERAIWVAGASESASIAM